MFFNRKERKDNAEDAKFIISFSGNSSGYFYRKGHKDSAEDAKFLILAR